MLVFYKMPYSKIIYRLVFYPQHGNFLQIKNLNTQFYQILRKLKIWNHFFLRKLREFKYTTWILILFLIKLLRFTMFL